MNETAYYLEQIRSFQECDSPDQQPRYQIFLDTLEGSRPIDTEVIRAALDWENGLDVAGEESLSQFFADLGDYFKARQKAEVRR